MEYARTALCGRGSGGRRTRFSAMSYPYLQHQQLVLDLARFFDKYAERMN